MAFYIKVTKQVADKLGVAGIRNGTADGNVLLWQADVAGFPGDTVFDRAAVVGGVCLSPQQAKGEIDGVEDPVEVTTPPEYMDLPTESEEESKDESSEEVSSGDESSGEESVGEETVNETIKEEVTDERSE